MPPLATANRLDPLAIMDPLTEPAVDRATPSASSRGSTLLFQPLPNSDDAADTVYHPSLSAKMADMPAKPISDLTEVHCDGFAVHDLLRRQDTEIGHIGDQVRHCDHQQRTSHDRRQVSHGILQLFQQVIHVRISVEAPQTGDQRRTEATEAYCITEGCRRREILHGNRGIRRT